MSRRSMKQALATLFSLSIYLFSSAAWACDPCALYNVSRLQGHSENTFTLSISEQYTDYDRPEDSNSSAVRDGEFVRGFSTTQFSLTYDVSEQFGLQLTLPVIARRFDEVEHFRADTDSDAGIGDLSLVGNYTFYDYLGDDWKILAGVSGGIKFPTGDTGVLREVTEEEEEAHLDSALMRHHSIGSASGGRALTFGSGSYDFITGASVLTRYQRYILLGTAQYTFRTEGDFDYEFADDFLWTVSTGGYLSLDHDFSCAALVSLSGEFKGKDHLEGELVKGSQASNLYLGPGVFFTLGESFAAEVAVDFRVTGEDVDATVVPEARVRAGISYRFS